MLSTDSETESEIASNSTVSATSSNNDELPYCEYSTERLKWRKQQLKILRGSSPQLSRGENGHLCQLLCDCHDKFSLEEGKRGETSLVEFEVDTGQSLPKKQPAWRVLHSAHWEIANQLQKMQNAGVIQESPSPWTSPVVFLRKCDGSLWFCVDYQNLNSVTSLIFSTTQD